MKFLFVFPIIFSSFANAAISDGIFFYFIGSSYEDHKILNLNDDFSTLIGTKYYQQSRPTVLATHGFLNNYKSAYVQTLINAYLARGDHNIIIIDWGKISSNINYVEVANTLDEISLYAVEVLLKMKSVGFDLSTFHLVGHSLGAQLHSRIGKNLAKRLKDFSFRRMTGLDPAGPLFFSSSKVFNIPITGLMPLCKGDAKFVDVIHTDIDMFGNANATADIDFFPNGGASQPGCDFANCLRVSVDECAGCDHSKAWQLYTESVARKNPKVFMSQKCLPGVTVYTPFFCLGPATAFMGFYADQTQPSDYGTYYLTTNGKPMYSKS